MRKFRSKLIAFVAGLLLAPAIVWGALEGGTYISDLVATNPLGSDLASTLDDHIRLLKSTIKNTFPNINGAVTVTDEQLNAVAANIAANPTATIGLTAVNGSASSYIRSDGAPALSQAIVPTWTATHTFTKQPTTSIDGGWIVSAGTPLVTMNETDGTTNNKVWDWAVAGETLFMRTATDAGGTPVNWLTVDRTGTTIDRVVFPTATSRAFVIGFDDTGTLNSNLLQVGTNTASQTAARFYNETAASTVISLHNKSTINDNNFIAFFTEGGGGLGRGSITYNRAGGVVAYNTTSDGRLKKNITPAKSALSVIDCVKISSYDWKDTGNHVEHGVIAQQLNECAPYAVSSSNDPKVMWQVDPSKLVPALIKYSQELESRISRLEANAARSH